MSKIYFLVLLVGATVSANAQYIDHVKGTHGVAVGAGIGDKTFLYRVGYYYWFAKNFSVRGDFFHVMTRPNEVPGFSLTRYGFDAALAYRVATYKGILFFHIFLGLTTAWNSLKVEEGVLAYEDRMKFGFLGGGEMEVRLYKKLMGVLAGDSRYMMREDFGNWRVYGMLGLRYSF